MTNPATVADIESRWRPLTPAETIVANKRLDDAWRKLKRAIPTLETRMVGDDDLTDTVIEVLADSVIRVLEYLSSGGKKRRTVSVDDGSVTYESDTDSNRASLYFTEGELADLSGGVVRTRARAFSVQPC